MWSGSGISAVWSGSGISAVWSGSGISAGLPELGISVQVKNNLLLGYKKIYCSQI